MQKMSILLMICLLAAACSSSSSGGSGGGGSTTKGDTTKNTSTVTAKGDTGTSVDMKVEKPVDKGDADTKTLGASNAGKQLVLYVTKASTTGSSVLNVFIDTEKHPLPATGIPVGAENSDAWVLLTLAGATTGTFLSKDKGTIDIDLCPTAQGAALTGKFNGVVVYNPAPVGDKEFTLDGPFNLVYFGGAGALTCKPTTTGGTDAGTSGGGADAGSGGGKSDMGKLAKPAGATCDANPCDGGANTSRNCCPVMPCIAPCYEKCATDSQKCATACRADMGCAMGCVTTVMACLDKCPKDCNASAACENAIKAYNQCGMNNSSACDGTGTEEQDDACIFDKCCAEVKAAF